MKRTRPRFKYIETDSTDDPWLNQADSYEIFNPENGIIEYADHPNGIYIKYTEEIEADEEIADEEIWTPFGLVHGEVVYYIIQDLYSSIGGENGEGIDKYIINYDEDGTFGERLWEILPIDLKEFLPHWNPYITIERPCKKIQVTEKLPNEQGIYLTNLGRIKRCSPKNKKKVWEYPGVKWWSTDHDMIVKEVHTKF